MSTFQQDGTPANRGQQKNPDASGFDGAEAQNRTGDTAIFSRVLYQLSYLGNVKLAQKTLPQCAKTAIL